MKLMKKFILGICQTTCYLVEHEQKNILVDAGENSEKIVAYLEEHNMTLDIIMITHAHFDHIAGLNVLTQKYPDVEVYIADEEKEFLKDPNLTLATDFNSDFTYMGDTNSYRDLNLPNFEARYISGHSLNSTVLIFKDAKTVFSGDTLFKGSVGRSDFINGNQEKLLSGIKSELFTLDNDYKVYPGHGFSTTIELEKTTNMFFN